MAVPEDNPNYNKLYSIFVDPNKPESDQLQGLIAYGLYKRAKAEWAKGIWQANSRAPTAEELAQYHATWTPTNLQAISDRATSALAEFAQSVVDEATPEIRRRALEGTYAKNVGTNVVGTFVYSAILIVLVLILRWFGVDILGLFQKLGPSN